MADDIIDHLATACTCGPLDADDACLPCCARTEIERLRAAGDAMAEALRSGSDSGWDEAIDAWEEARRG